MNDVKFTEKDFKTLRNFQNRMSKVFGENAYVGTDYATVVLEYSPALKSMLRPFPPVVYDYEVKMLVCEECKRTQMFLSSAGETTFVCDDCKSKVKKKNNPVAVVVPSAV